MQQFKLIFTFSMVVFLFAATISQKPIQAQNEQFSNVKIYQYPRIIEKDTRFTFRVNGEPVELIETTAGPFASFACRGATDVEIDLPAGFPESITVSPLAKGIDYSREGNTIRFRIPGPGKLILMADLLPQLFIFANDMDDPAPDPSDPNVIYFKEGQVYEVGDLELTSGQTLFIEGGAVVRGAIQVYDAENVRIAGAGIIDNSYFTDDEDKRRVILVEGSRNVTIEDLTMIEPTAWMVVIGNSQFVTIDGVNLLSYVSARDGIDLVGSSHIKVLNSLLNNGDDCVAIKSFDQSRYFRFSRQSYATNVENIEVRGCVLISHLGGHAFEIGHELTTDSITNIRYIDNDVLGIHGHGGVFGINNSDRAVVSNILYEDIRVEHYYNKLVNLRVIKSRFYGDDERGQVRNVIFRNIDITNSRYNPGYSVSVIGGYDENHTVENVVFENFRVNGEKVTSGDQIYLFTKQARGIVFR